MERVSKLAPTKAASFEMKQVLGAWSALAEGGHEVYASQQNINDSDIAGYQTATGGGRLPKDLRALYEVSRDGYHLLDLMIEIFAWPPESAADFGIAEEPGYPMPDQLQVFGGNMGDTVWAFWLQRGQIQGSTPVMALFDHEVAGIRSIDRFGSFLRLETASGLLRMQRDDGVSRALDALELPERLRDVGLDETELDDELMRWANVTGCGNEGHYASWEPLEADQLEGLTRDLP